MNMPFQTRLVVFFLSLFVVVELLTVGAVYTAAKQRVIENSRDALVASSFKFQSWLDDNVRRLTELTRVLASDFGFRSAVATEDRRTILSALDNLRDRIDVDRALLIDLNGAIMIDNVDFGWQRRQFPFVEMTNAASQEQSAAKVVVFDERIYQLVVVPVLAPDVIAWIGVAIEINNSELERLRTNSTIPLDITFAFRGAGMAWQPVASTLNVEALADITRILDGSEVSDGAGEEPQIVRVAGSQYVALSDCHKAAIDPNQVCKVFQYSLDAALVPYRKLFYLLAIIGLVGVMLTLLGCLFVARGITRPLRVLDAATRRIRSGNYSKKIRVNGHDEIGRLSVAFNDMIDSIAARENHIAYQLRHDMLTQLPNRLEFETQVSRTIDSNEGADLRFSILLLDIERFSEINNTLGHDVGDELLKDISVRLQGSLKRTDLVARIANSSFVVLLKGADVVGAIEAVKRLVKAFDSAFSVCGLRVDVAVRMGVATYPDHGQHTRTLLRHAEVALSLAKQSVHRYAIYDRRTDPYRPELLSLMSDLRVGLDHGEFLLHYQPKINLVTGEPRQVEALVRWHHRQHGFMPPDKFIPLAERTGYVQLLTAFVIRTALAECREWQADGFKVGVAINLSVKDLLDPAICMSISKALSANNLDPADVTLEITETAVMAQPEYSLAQLNALASLGVNIAIDDYGTGYSSMAYVKRLPVTELKIDKTFVIDLANSKEDEMIVHSTIELGHNLGLTVTAEGVEDAESLAKLQASGCDYAQGFLFARPLEKRDLLKYMGQLKRARSNEGESATIHRLPG
jgi:diguanylate cyclase (GGDEF)-like protein